MNREILLCFVVVAVGVSAVSAQTMPPVFTLPEFPSRDSSDAISTASYTARLTPLDADVILEDEAAESTNDAPSPTPFRRSVDGRLELSPNIQMRGRIEAEATMAGQSTQSKATLGDLQNGYGFRRVRLGAQGNIEESTSWVSEVELAGGNVRLRDAFVGLDALPGVRQIRIGHFREPYNLEGMTSSNFITFLERAATNVLSPVRNWGVCGYWWPEDERMLFSLGAFRDGTGSNGQSTGDGDNWAYTTRLTGLPVYDSDESDFRLIHLGAAFSQRVPPNGVINFTPRFGSSLLTVEDNPGSPFLPSVNIRASDYQLYNLQAAGVLGSFSMQAEWTAAAVQQQNAGVVFVHGIYLYGSYFLTGEHRSYNRTRGSFDRIDVIHPVTRKKDSRSGIGAVELAARFAYLDFDSPSMPLDVNGAPAGTRLYEATIGLNWHLNTYTRIMADYTAGMPDKVGFGPTLANIYGIRTAIFW